MESGRADWCRLAYCSSVDVIVEGVFVAFGDGDLDFIEYDVVSLDCADFGEVDYKRAMDAHELCRR